MRKDARRSAFSFIELIFSIVVVGLVILSIPLIVRQSNANAIESQNVLGYYNALTLMETIRSKPWDAANVADFKNSGEYYILLTDENAPQCKRPPKNEPGDPTAKANYWTKDGLGNADRRRMCDPGTKDDPTPRRATAIVKNDKLESIGAFNDHEGTTNVGGNAFFKLKVKVEYVDANLKTGINPGNPAVFTGANGRTSDVKKITITLRRNNPIKDTQDDVSTYTYYAANIGTDVPFSKANQ